MDNFDKFAIEYDKSLNDTLNKNIGISSDYFAEYKVNELSKFFIDKDKPLNILDFGCGTGKNSILINSKFPDSNTYGIDISGKSIQVAQQRENNKCKFSVYNGIDIGFEDNFFDVIFISNVFHHINHDEHMSILDSLKKVLSPGGYIFMFEHNTFNPLTLKIVNECEFDRDAKLLNVFYSKKLFKRVGFNNIITKFILFIPPSLKKLLFVEKYLSWLPLGGQYYIIGRK